jgi:hypothetical protein
MELEKYILAAITTNEKKVGGGTPVFCCDSKDELEIVAANLEAILDGIAHQISNDVFIIVKH